MGRERTSGSGLETELAKHKGIEIHGGKLRVVFMWRRIRCRKSLGLPITKANIKHAALLRAAILHEIKTGHFEYGRTFLIQSTRPTTAVPRTKGLGHCWNDTSR